MAFASVSQAQAQSQAGSDTSDLEPLLVRLVDASLSEAVELIPQLETQGGRGILPLFTAMFDNSLAVDPDSMTFYRLAEDNSARPVYPPADAGDSAELQLSAAEADELERIRVSNRLRVLLRDAIARIRLFEGDADERSIAAAELLSQLGEDTVLLLREALASEEDAEVREVLEVGIAMNVLVSDAPDEERLQVVPTLHGRLEAPVRNLLNSLLDPNGRNEQNPEVRAAIEEANAAIDTRIRFYGFIEELFYGLSLGSVLLLAAIGLAVTFGVMGVINMAHGEMLMLGAYTTYVVQLVMPGFITYSLWVAIPAAFLVSASVGILIQRYVIRYLHGRPLETLLATFGISLILQQTVRTIFSPLNRMVVSPEWMSGTIQINPVLAITNNRLFILIFSLIVFFALLMILRKTSLGLQVRAVSQNRNMAKAMGIRTDRVDALTFGLGSGIAGIAGVALSQLTNVGPNLGQSYIIDSFMVVVFGGVGNLFGTLVGAFSLGVSNKFLEPAVGAVLAKIITLVFIIVFIQFRPKGLFPQKGRAAE
ncbi:MAG: urea ABC transporter permease subunit UrtB [Gammaproteobacteria bacterium]|nr:urea ABC transporter permease subunit UrtB [Gammaproteobacteria bacterium]MBJ53826.1 urea ABC transporter permease subunit UrtB [Gammaproteobacteria bacterium]HBN13682.1 urea ABC transporter permease subunit UrtB [Pseudohongiella sp.]|tara:strand:- start:1273 stop:2886 length:1614 start_codon:yes stop_codon:yes gene_type:complete